MSLFTAFDACSVALGSLLILVSMFCSCLHLNGCGYRSVVCLFLVILMFLIAWCYVHFNDIVLSSVWRLAVVALVVDVVVDVVLHVTLDLALFLSGCYPPQLLVF